MNMLIAVHVVWPVLQAAWQWLRLVLRKSKTANLQVSMNNVFLMTIVYSGNNLIHKTTIILHNTGFLSSSWNQ